ncbi:MAG: hypothetical protein ACKO7W_19750 [Elainella sp.]
MSKNFTVESTGPLGLIYFREQARGGDIRNWQIGEIPAIGIQNYLENGCIDNRYAKNNLAATGGEAIARLRRTSLQHPDKSKIAPTAAEESWGASTASGVWIEERA